MTWRVVTQAAYYDFDFIAGTVTRHRLKGVGKGWYQARLRKDEQPVVLDTLYQCEVGLPLRMLIEELSPGAVTYRTSTPVISISQVSAPSML